MRAGTISQWPIWLTPSADLLPPKQKASYWRGTIPWVSPKDMKRWEIEDAADHVRLRNRGDVLQVDSRSSGSARRSRHDSGSLNP